MGTDPTPIPIPEPTVTTTVVEYVGAPFMALVVLLLVVCLAIYRLVKDLRTDNIQAQDLAISLGFVLLSGYVYLSVLFGSDWWVPLLILSVLAFVYGNLSATNLVRVNDLVSRKPGTTGDEKRVK